MAIRMRATAPSVGAALARPVAAAVYWLTHRVWTQMYVMPASHFPCQREERGSRESAREREREERESESESERARERETCIARISLCPNRKIFGIWTGMAV